MNTYLANILQAPVSTLPFVGSCTGLVRTVTITEPNAGGATQRKSFPVACNVSASQCNSGKYLQLVPDSSKTSLLYFEEVTGCRHIGFAKNNYQYRSTLRLVGWLNLGKLGINNCTWSAQAVWQILSALPTAPQNHGYMQQVKITTVTEVEKSAAIFSRYSYDEAVSQYLLYPYDYFALDITVEFQINPTCITVFTPGASNCET